MTHTSYPDLLYVEAVPDGLLVKFRTMFPATAGVRGLAEELYELSCERGGPRLHLDLAEVEELTDYLLQQLLALSKKLHGLGDHLVLLNLRPNVLAALHACRPTERLDIRRVA
jgi:anti-anti-sigma regulatory factor